MRLLETYTYTRFVPRSQVSSVEKHVRRFYKIRNDDFSLRSASKRISSFSPSSAQSRPTWSLNKIGSRFRMCTILLLSRMISSDNGSFELRHDILSSPSVSSMQLLAMYTCMYALCSNVSQGNTITTSKSIKH